MKKRIVRVTAWIIALILLLPLLPGQGAIEARADTVMSSADFVAKLIDIAENYKTLYVNGGWGWPMNSSNQDRAINSAVTGYNRQPEREVMVRAATPDTFGFDCICLIKAILWGWTGDVNHSNGGAAYKANGVADFGTGNAANYCTDVSENFDPDCMVPGELLLMSGHAGVYVGNGLVVECTPAWSNDVQISEIDSTGIRSKNGSVLGRWKKHGKLIYVNYVPSGHVHSDSCGWNEGYCETLGVWRPNRENRLLTRDGGDVIIPGIYRFNGSNDPARTGHPYEKLVPGENELWSIPPDTEVELLNAVRNGSGKIWCRIRYNDHIGYVCGEYLSYLSPSPSALEIRIDTGDGPVGNLPVGKAFGCGGKITSNYPITEVTGKLHQGNTVYYSYQASSLFTACYVIASDGLDNAMLFNKLAVGDYEYTVTAKDYTGQTRRYTARFSICDQTPRAVTYAVWYDARGGAPTPADQIKWQGVPLNLDAAAPVREGYTFSGWNTAMDGSGANYAPGSSFNADVNTCLYAQWTPAAPAPEDPPPDAPPEDPDPLWGDANGDGLISNKDIVRLKNYIANYDEDAGVSSDGTAVYELFPGADANGDGVISNKDIVRLKNYFANFDEGTGASTVTLGPVDSAG